jgi:hypothetical protein
MENVGIFRTIFAKVPFLERETRHDKEGGEMLMGVEQVLSGMAVPFTE